MRHESRTWFALDHPRLASPDPFRARQLEAVCVGNFGYELAVVFTFFALTFLPLSAIAL
jgi:hypothetical protein